MRILFVGQSWQGSSADSMRRALEVRSEVEIRSIAEDRHSPQQRGLVGRLLRRVVRSRDWARMNREIRRSVASFRPDAVLIYKGRGVTPATIDWVRSKGVAAVNVFPDCSPHAHGDQLRLAVGLYDLVISTKPFHPPNWSTIYGYTNRCVFVPHGYDPDIHLWPSPAGDPDVDVVLAASWRPEYEDLLQQLAQRLKGADLLVSVAGAGWPGRATRLPSWWTIAGPILGRGYGEWLRRGRIAIAPVNTQLLVGGVRQPGDEDTTRTYELAAASCFFLHRRTPFAQTLYDETLEVPMWGDAEELADLIRRFVDARDRRMEMARAAHRRAVPAYSIPTRAASIMEHLRQMLA